MNLKLTYRDNFVLLVFLHLLLFAYPIADKAIHRHEDTTACCVTAHTEGPSWQTPEQRCPVCDFQFLSFVEAKPVQAGIYLDLVALFAVQPVSGSFAPVISWFQLRAPPYSRIHRAGEIFAS